MGRYCFIMASTDGRLYLLNKARRCIRENKLYSDAEIYLYFQGADIEGIEEPDDYKLIIYDDKMRGVFTPRYELFKRTKDYDFTILIDDDCFLYPDTSYETAMSFLDFEERAGCVNIGAANQRITNEMVNISEKMAPYNIKGGLVLPKRSVKIILDYFADKEEDYSEDMFWLLLHIKGYDLWSDYGNRACHKPNRKDGKTGEESGFLRHRIDNPYKPFLTEWFNAPSIQPAWKKLGYERVGIKELSDINEEGKRERLRNLKRWEG